jgi:formylglycine-generating enzyme required for sulfatase activity
VNANTVISCYEEMDTEVGSSYEPMQRKQRRPEPRRKGHGGSSGGGMHCRRNKSHTWGIGAGARLADLRAFAGALALVLFGLLSPASAVEFTWQTVGSIGNAPNTSTGLGRVTENYKVSAYETTIAQYTEFLNNSHAGKQGLYGVWNSSIGSTTQNATEIGVGIERNGTAGSYSYTVKSADFANKPVNFVNWFSAARFVNWYANGQSNAATATETGSYTLNGATSGNIVARNAGAQVFLPSADEWTKAAFYNPQGQDYYLWPTQNNATPTAVLPVGNNTVATANAANFRGDRNANDTRMTNAGTYVNTTSTYGLFDMLGNVTEMTDTASTSTPSNFQAFGGSFATTSAQLATWNSNSTGEFRPGSGATEGLGSAGVGFRVAAVAVPEPGNMVAAAMGIGGLVAVQLAKRRKLALARVAG